jgi:NDP-sugar pyrophosphorylase family protein
MSLPVAILAGGLATRLRPVTEKIPKSLVTVAGAPFLAHQLRLLHSRGIDSAILCIGHLGDMIEAKFGSSAFGVNLKYSYDGPHLLGTGGALLQALPLLGERFFVLYGDSYLPIDYQAVARAFDQSGQPALMTVYENRDAYDRSNVEYADGRILRYDKKNRTPKMHHIDFGLSVFDAAVFNGYSAPFDLAELQRNLVEAGQMAGHPVTERFYEIGSHEELAELDTLLRDGGSGSSR